MGALWTDNKDILVMLSDMDINAIAGTLKLYFRELPEPLLTDRLYPAFMEGIGKGWEGEGDDAQTLFGIACSGMVHSQGSFPSSAHLVLAVLAGSRPAQGWWCCSPVLTQWLLGGIWLWWVLLLQQSLS